LQAKKGYDYPLWQRPFFTLALLSNLHGPCRFCVELRLDQVVREKVIQRTDWLSINPGNDPLRVHPVSIMMKAAELPRRGVYHLCFVWDKEELARATIHAR
jgi:hypothetical protein